MKKQIYLKPEIYVVNAEPEMLLAGSPIGNGNRLGSSDTDVDDSWEED